jgi:hypothetical protein
MKHTWLFPFAGAALGFLGALVLVPVLLGTEPARDRNAITLFVGTFLAGSGAIAGAISGAAAESFTSRQRASDASAPRESED